MKVFESVPRERPDTPLLNRIKSPSDMTQLDSHQLAQLADELRAYMMYSVGTTGGHFGAGLGVIELTVALHHVLHAPLDKLVWDVGHQAYPHKILTGRKNQMHSLRQKNGIAAFPCRTESVYDSFGVGHSSTSISACLGMAVASRLSGLANRHVAVIGDGAITAGMAMEALSHAGDVKANMLVILNDNQMSISESVGGLSSYFSRIWSSHTYNNLRQNSKKVLEAHPLALSFARKTEEHVKGLVTPGTFFEELGFNYIGPIDGHDLDELVRYIEKLSRHNGPQLLHIVTTKGKGYKPAEQDPIGYHALNKLEKPVKNQAADKQTVKPDPTTAHKQKYCDVFGQWLCDQAAADERLVGITPAMREGSNLIEFSKRYPDRYFDVAIAEQHALTFAAGLACEHKKPVVAIYSTFLQRAYDQLIHDIALQNLDVLFAIDRAGLVGADGATHNGNFDLSYLRCIPNMVIMAAADENECRQMLHTGYMYQGPAAVRYPRGNGPGVDIQQRLQPIPIGQSRTIRQGKKIAILNFGALLHTAIPAAETLNATLIDMRFIKPLDTDRLITLMQDHQVLITLEENTVAGGAGSCVMEWLQFNGYLKPLLALGLPDKFIDHGSVSELLKDNELDTQAIIKRIQAFYDHYLLQIELQQPETEKVLHPS